MSRAKRTHTPLGAVIYGRGLRVGDVAADSGVHDRYLSEYLSGRCAIRPVHLRKLAEALGVPAAKLQTPPAVVAESLAAFGRVASNPHD